MIPAIRSKGKPPRMFHTVLPQSDGAQKRAVMRKRITSLATTRGAVTCYELKILRPATALERKSGLCGQDMGFH